MVRHRFCRKSSPASVLPLWWMAALLRGEERCAGAHVGRAQGVWGWEKLRWVGTVQRWQAAPHAACRPLTSPLGDRLRSPLSGLRRHLPGPNCVCHLVFNGLFIWRRVFLAPSGQNLCWVCPVSFPSNLASYLIFRISFILSSACTFIGPLWLLLDVRTGV